MRDIKPLTPIQRCFLFFPQFHEDFEILIKNKIIIKTGNIFTWNKKKTSLAEYFHDFKGKSIPVEGGFWCPIETAFNIKRGSLRNLASPNGRGSYGVIKKSRDYEIIINILKPYREKIQAEKQFLEIKKIIDNTQGNYIQSMLKIKNIVYSCQIV